MAIGFTWWSASGGPGKTTNAMQTAAAIGRDGYNVLAVDLDPQRGALTHYCGYGELTYDDEDTGYIVEPNIMDVLFDNIGLDEIIVETEHFDLVPGHEDMGNFESAVADSPRMAADQFFVVRDAIEELSNGYDVVIVDTQATHTKLVDNALVAAQNIMVPIELTPKGKASQKELEDTLAAIEKGFRGMNVDVTICGTVPCRVGNAKIFEEYREQMESEGIPISPFSIPEHSLLRYTWDKRMDLFSFIESDETRELRSYEEHVPLAYKVIGRWMVGEYSYEEAIDRWDDVKDMKMGDATPEKLLEGADPTTEVDA
ncbi:ParA family protein [Halomicroarcula sp. GCM10025709]|uniref:ParA family protein n=1 Tax=Haloarcula TaxID=2237 RepID=UPI0024C39FB7|nr:ParA family protein [Halomicroarcula sp. YJ-61-S]